LSAVRYIFFDYVSAQLYVQPGSRYQLFYVVLDPITMTPMITHGGNITVNPLGVPSNICAI